MEIILKPKAQKALFLIGSFVEQNNTKGSGANFIKKFSLKLQSYAKENSQYTICKNNVLNILGFCCITINYKL